MNASLGSTETTLAFDTVGQSAYWYVDEMWPPGSEDYGIVAGNYTFSMYFDELPQPWWDSNYSFQRPVNISAGASSIPTGYPVKLTFDHAQFVLDGKSQADGDDIRLVFWTGSAWTELGRVLESGSSWNDAATTILFKTQAVVPASSTDTNHFLYYNHSGATSPPTNTLAARYFLAESLGETQTSSSSYANKVQLQFTPSDASEHWVIVASWRQRNVGGAGSTVSLGEARITVNGSPRTGTETIGYEMSGDLWNDNGALFKITGTTAQQTIGLDFRADGGTDAIDSARILAFMIPDPSNADIQYGESLTRRNESVDPTDVLTTTFTPTSAGDYVWFANGFHHEGPGGGSGSGLYAEDEAAVDQQHSTETYLSSVSDGFVPLVHFEERTLGTSSQTFALRFQPDTADSEIQGLTQLLFRSDVFEGVETADAASRTTTTSSTFQTKVSLTTALQSTDRDYVYLVVMNHDDDGSGDSLTLGSENEIRLNGTQQLQTHMRIDRGTYETPMAWAYAETVPGDRTIDARFRSDDATVTAEAEFAHILALRYKEPALTLDPEETESAGSEGVEITASVHHTRPDGTDPQEIVASSPVTIDENTTHPFILDIGTGGAQTFTASDPRRLRLFVNVTDVTGGGRFVLAYNSSANPTNLETPVTGLRPILFNPTLVPASGSTATNFNFTIDYRHSGGNPANVVRVNVSDAANGTYNNFTMSPTTNPDVDYFVQSFQDLTGTTSAFANAQNDSDSGASALLEQQLVITGSSFARPDGDVSNAGAWTPTPLWSRLDETSPDDSSTMVSTGQNPTTADTFEVSLTNVADPFASTNHIIRFRARGDDGGRDNFLEMRLYQGSTQIASTGVEDVTTSWTTFTYTLTSGQANSITDYNNLRLRFIPDTTGTGPGSRVDVTWAELEVPVTETQLLIQFNTTGIRSIGEDTLVLRYNLTSSDDTFGVWVWDFATSDWRNRGTLDQTVASFFNYSLTGDEKSGGEVRIRFNDTSSGSTDVSVDYQLVNNKLWKSGVTYYYNTTLAAGEYSHFFWANDTVDVANRTATFAGPSVLAPPAISNFRLEDALAASRAGEQLDVDTEYFLLFNVTDESSWGDIGDGGNVSLRLWYDGNGSAQVNPVTTQRDPAVCQAGGANWTSCTNAFASDGNYAYANNSGGAATILEVNATGDTTTTSGSYVLMDSMSLTPGAGDYLAVFSTSVRTSSEGHVRISLFVNGVQQTHTEREQFQEASIAPAAYPIATHGSITVGAGETVEVRWLVTAGTGTANQRTLNLFPVDSADTSQATATADDSTSSTSYTLLGGMTLTPGAGDYLLLFSTSADGPSGTRPAFAVFVNGAILQHTERTIDQEPSIPNTEMPVFIAAKVSPGPGEVVEIRWAVQAGSGTIVAHERTLTLFRTDAANIFEVNATSDTSATNTADALLAGMTLTPGAGTYLALFSESHRYGTFGVNLDTYYSFYVNGVQTAHTERLSTHDESVDNADIAAMTSGIVSPGDGQAAEVQWRGSTTDSRTAHERTFVLLKASAGGMEDTAWKEFGFSLGSDTINTVEVGVEWFRNNTAPILNVTVSWDGGSSWATNQTATNKSADDNTVEFLDFTAATAWTGAKLGDANLQVRAGTNASGARLDYITARVVSTPLPTTQRNATACEAYGDNWTNCDDALSSNDAYAYANGTSAGAIVFDAATNATSTSSPLQWNHPIGGGSNRLLVVGCGVEDDTISSITYNGVTMDGPAVSRQVGIEYGDIWWMNETNLPAAGSYQISASTVGAVTEIDCIATSVSGAAQTLAEATASNDDGQSGAGSINTDITTLTNGAWVFDLVGSGNAITFTPDSPQIERGDITGGTSGAAMSTEFVASAGLVNLGWTADSASNRLVHVLAAWAPAPVPAGGNDTVWKDFGFAFGSNTIDTVEVGVEWFRTSAAPILNVTVSWDGGTTWATNQTATNKSADDDTVEWLDFTAATAWTPTTLNDANLRVRLGTNASGGRLDHVTVRVTLTSELTFSEQTTGANYRIELKYVDTSDPSTASLSEWSVAEGNAVFNASASSLTPIFSGPKLIGYEFKLALKLGFQVKQANDPVNSAVGGYNDLNSWNAEIVASDGVDTTTEQTASTGDHMEFGVYMYTFVNISADWTVAVGAGNTGNTNTVTVYYRSNDDFRVLIWFTTHLVKGGDTIGISNVTILAAADLADNITADTPFVGLGESNATYIFGSATWWFTHATDANENTVAVQFSVTVPASTPIGTYVAQLTIRSQQEPAG
jgi:hypothetical protein